MWIDLKCLQFYKEDISHGCMTENATVSVGGFEFLVILES